MKFNYIMDISDTSISVSHTPSLLSRQLPFYIHDCGHFYAGKNYYTEREGLDNYLLIFTCSGYGKLQYRQREIVLKPLEAVVIHCLEYQLYKTESLQDWEFYWVHFNGIASKNYFEIINESSIYSISISEATSITEAFENMLKLCINNGISNDVECSLYLTNIISKIVLNRLNPETEKSSVQHKYMIESVMSFIESNYKNRIYIRDLLSIALMSEYHFLRIYKKYTGSTPYEYITNYRINKSKALLKETNLSINEISYEVGFSNVNNYIRSFKKLVGTTPHIYRNYWII